MKDGEVSGEEEDEAEMVLGESLKRPQKGELLSRKQQNCKGGTPNRIKQPKPKRKGIEAFFEGKLCTVRRSK